MSRRDVEKHDDAVTETYHEQYRRENLFSAKAYPANYIRLQLLLSSFVPKGVKRVLEVGVGEGTPPRRPGGRRNRRDPLQAPQPLRG